MGWHLRGRLEPEIGSEGSEDLPGDIALQAADRFAVNADSKVDRCNGLELDTFVGTMAKAA